MAAIKITNTQINTLFRHTIIIIIDYTLIVIAITLSIFNNRVIYLRKIYLFNVNNL